METPNFKKSKFEVINESPKSSDVSSKPKKMFKNGMDSKIPKISPTKQSVAEVS
jgi:hypothetical protein